MFDKETVTQFKEVVREVMFDQAAIKKLELVVGRVIDEKVPPIVERAIDEKLMSLMEHQIMPQFEEIHGRIDGVRDELHQTRDELKQEIRDVKNEVRTQSVSKNFLEDRLDNFRIDHGLKYKSAN